MSDPVYRLQSAIARNDFWAIVAGYSVYHGSFIAFARTSGDAAQWHL
jgi:hypothetical protein